eukprot:8588364-Alexandrium_andersonii.AAC.1
MADLVRNPYEMVRHGSAAARVRAAQSAGNERIGRPPPDGAWAANGEDPAEVAEEAGGYLAVPAAATQTFWDS